ncbi:hypothetical protein [Hirschia litorea]|uniref:Uncharacterized protein n=1 Tax=Hirschia litorea TaxID=1199156 RepID=A0ABW2IK58_9PROT
MRPDKLQKAIWSARLNEWAAMLKKAWWLILLLIMFLTVKIVWHTVPFTLEGHQRGTILSTAVDQTDFGAGATFATVKLENGDIVSAKLSAPNPTSQDITLCQFKRTLIWEMTHYKVCDLEQKTDLIPLNRAKSVSDLASIEVCKTYRTHDCEIKAHPKLEDIPSFSASPDKVRCILKYRVLESGYVNLLNTECSDDRFLKGVIKSAEHLRYGTTDTCGRTCPAIGQELEYPLEIQFE